MEFCRYINDSRKDKYVGNQKIVLIMDQHSAHSGETSGVRTFLRNNFESYFVPSSTCWMNSAEFLIAVTKEKLKQYFIRCPDEVIRRDDFVRRVSEQLGVISASLCGSNIWLANIRDLRQTIYHGDNN